MARSTSGAGLLRARLRGLVSVAATLVVVSLWIIVAAVPAEAHDQLLRTTPTDGAILKSAPPQLVMTFGQGPLSGTEHVAAFNHLGESVPISNVRLQAQSLIADWPTAQPPGTYRIAWRVTSPDGHPIDGEWSFTYGMASPQPMATSGPSTDQSSSSAVPVLILAGVGIAILAIIGWLFVRRGP